MVYLYNGILLSNKIKLAFLIKKYHNINESQNNWVKEIRHNKPVHIVWLNIYKILETEN